MFEMGSTAKNVSGWKRLPLVAEMVGTCLPFSTSVQFAYQNL